MKNLIGIQIIGGCSLSQKENAVIDLKKAIDGKLKQADLEKMHHKALHQGKLGELYDNIKSSLKR